MISYPFPPNASAGAVRSERFARYLPLFDWSVEVVTIKPRKDIFEDSGRLERLGRNVKVNFTRTLDPWLRLKEIKPNGLVLRGIRSVLMRIFSFPDHMFLWVPFAVWKGLEICKKRKVDAIYSTSPPHSSHLAARILSLLTQKPWVADFRDPWTLNAYRGKGFLERFLLKTERILEKGVLKRASVILANTKANRRNLLKAFPFLSEGKVVYLPNGWEEFPKEFYQTEKKGDPLTIVHAGTFYPRFKPYGLFYALAAWRNGERPPDIPPLKVEAIKVILLGARDEETTRIVRELNISELVETRPWVALEEARKIMCQADLLWTTLGTKPESSTYVPSKIFEYIAANKPIIGFFPLGEAESLIRKTGTGVVFTSDNPEPILRFLDQIISPQGSNGLKSWYNPDRELIDYYHFFRISSRLAELFERTTTGR